MRSSALEKATQRHSNPGVHVVALPIGARSTGGDAIAIKYVLPPSDPVVVCIDSGRTEEHAQALIATVRNVFGCDAIDILIVTHSDDDHAAGVLHLFEAIEVREIWINDPRAAVTASAGTAVAVIGEADDRQIIMRSALRGTCSNDGVVEIVGPDGAFYEELRPRLGAPNEVQADPIVASAAVAELDTWEDERLVGTDSSTSATNSSSAITLLWVGDILCLFTGDAGVLAIGRAAEALGSRRYEPSAANLVQVPHHGSKHNLDSATAEILAGMIVPEGQKWSSGQAFASCPADGSKGHPSHRVVNAFVRRGRKVFTTAGSPFHFTYGSYQDAAPVDARQVPPADFVRHLPPGH